MLWAWLLPVAVVELHDGDLHAVGWGEGPLALVTPVKAIRVGVGLKKGVEDGEATNWKYLVRCIKY